MIVVNPDQSPVPQQLEPSCPEACEACGGSGWQPRNVNYRRDPCPDCQGSGFVNLQADRSCRFAPGSEQKIAVLRARYEAGIPLWNDFDVSLTAANETAANETASDIPDSPDEDASASEDIPDNSADHDFDLSSFSQRTQKPTEESKKRRRGRYQLTYGEL